MTVQQLHKIRTYYEQLIQHYCHLLNTKKATKPNQELRSEPWYKERYAQLTSKNVRGLGSLNCSVSQFSSEAAQLQT